MTAPVDPRASPKFKMLRHEQQVIELLSSIFTAIVSLDKQAEQPVPAPRQHRTESKQA